MILSSIKVIVKVINVAVIKILLPTAGLVLGLVVPVTVEKIVRSC